MTPRSLEQYGYGRFPEVYTSLEFERLNNATGPTSGKVVMKNGKVPERVAIIHCVGSRDTRHKKYCSRVCCMYSMKFAHLLREKTGAEVWEFYIDIRSPGKLYEEFYNRVQEEGVRFVRGRVAEITDIVDDPKDEGRLTVIAESTLTRRTVRVPVDMVILSVGMEPARGSEDIGRLLGCFQGRRRVVQRTSCQTGSGCHTHQRDFPGRLLPGSQGYSGYRGPVHGRGRRSHRPAGQRALSPPRPRYPILIRTCARAARAASSACAYSAIRFDEARRVAVVNEALCMGCGSCAAACPSSAAGVRHFTDRQVMGEIEALLM